MFEQSVYLTKESYEDRVIDAQHFIDTLVDEDFSDEELEYMQHVLEQD